MEEIEERQIEFHSEEVQEMMGQVPSWIMRWGITIIAIVLFGLLLGSYFFKYPDTLTASVIVTSSSTPVELNAYTTGKVENLFVCEKQIVHAGDYLAIIGNNANSEDVLKLNQLFQEWQCRKLSSILLYEELKHYTLSLGEIQSTFLGFMEALKYYNLYINSNYYSQKLALKKKQLSKQLEMNLDRNYEYVYHAQQANISENAHFQDTILSGNKNKIGEDFDDFYYPYLQEHRAQLNDIRVQKEIQMLKLQYREVILDLKQQYKDTYERRFWNLKRASDQLENAINIWKKNYVITSPISGYVNMISVWSKNQNVTAGDVIMIVMPKTLTEPVGKAKFPADGVGKIQIGQRVLTRLNNYPDEEFGSIEGVVSNISDFPDKDDNYIVDIKFPNNLKTSYGIKLPQGKMILGNVQIIIKDKRMIEVLIQPLEKIFNNIAVR